MMRYGAASMPPQRALYAVVFVFANTLLVIVDVRSGAGASAVLGLDWPYWLILCWGIGLAAHAIHALNGYDRS